jgi:hypothetical protein
MATSPIDVSLVIHYSLASIVQQLILAVLPSGGRVKTIGGNYEAGSRSCRVIYLQSATTSLFCKLGLSFVLSVAHSTAVIVIVITARPEIFELPASGGGLGIAHKYWIGMASWLPVTFEASNPCG